MRSFAELLREYIARTGVSDAELARAVGVQRQTIFRWKEGLVARPRSAEDVLRLAGKLRLSEAERDELLLAGGFPPRASRSPGPPVVLTPAEPEPVVAESRDAGVPLTSVPRRRLRARWIVPLITTLVLLVAGAVIGPLLGGPVTRLPHAREGETLLLVAQFANFTRGTEGYNVAGRLREALERELTAAGLHGVRAAEWPRTVSDEATAQAALDRSAAVLLIWGEYDSGRVVARFRPAGSLAAPRELSLLSATPADLSAVINSTLPGDIRYVALTSLAQICLAQDRVETALAVMGKASLNLPADPQTQAAHHFLAGYARQAARPPDHDAAIRDYTAALALDDALDAARNNRAIAYLKRRAAGDAEAAIADLTRYVAGHPDDAQAWNNRGTAYFLLGGPDNLSLALADFDRAIGLAPDDPAGYYNRGLAYVRRDAGEQWQADFSKALALQSDHPGALQGLCWGYALSAEPARAVDFCRQAVAGGAASANENLAVALARSGDTAGARAALEAFRRHLSGTSDAAPSLKQTQVDRWIDELAAGRSPFDAAVLAGLREE